MKRIVVVLALLSVIAAAVAFGYLRQSSKKEHDNAEYVGNIENTETVFGEIDLSGKKEYTSKRYKIYFACPEDWNISVDENNADGRVVSFSAINDFLNIDALEGENLGIETMVLNEVYQKGQPYGENPRIYPGRVNGMEGMFIEPSPDQNKSFKNQSVCILKFPKPLEVDNKSYRYLRIHSSKDMIGIVAKSLKQI